MKGIKKRPIRIAPNLVLESVGNTKVYCPSCGSKIDIDWLEKLEYPIQYSKSATPDIFWVPMTIPVICKIESCRYSFHLNTPEKKVESKWHLYGDEAARYISEPLQTYSDVPINFFTISLVFCHITKQEKLKNEIIELKKTLGSHLDYSKPLHFYKIWNTNQFFETKSEKIEFAFKFANIIKKFNNNLLFYSFSSCSKILNSDDRAVIINKQKHETFQVSLLTTLAILRENQKSVKWIFDNVSDSSSGKVRTEGWAEEIFLGLQYTRQFTWLSARSVVEKAEFVQPGSHYLLEIADFISFVVAREFDLTSRGQDIEISSARFGKGFYCSRIGNGDYDSCDSVGFPKRRFYGFQN